MAEDPDMQITEQCPNCTYWPTCPVDCATLMVFSNNKPRGRIGLANYVMPFQVTAKTDANNQRRKGKR